MHRRSGNEGPGFFWQGLLIVLPVVLLAGLGLFSLRQDRRLAEQDARQRAQDTVQQLASGLGRRVGSHLEDVLFVPASLSESGELAWPPLWQAAPAPPGWWNAFSEAQWQAWQGAQALEFGSGSDSWSIA